MLLSRPERIALVDWERRELPLTTQAELLGLNRSSLYYAPKGPSEEEIRVKHTIDRIFTDHPYYGSRRMSAALRREGLRVNRKAVQRHMREMGLEAVYPGPNLSRRSHQHKVFPYLLRNITIDTPNAVWGTDITFIRLSRGWMYLAVFMDWYSRYIVSWELSDQLSTDFVLEALDRGLSGVKPEIINSDQGVQYTSIDYINRVLSAGVQVSMDGRGRAIDNVFTERFWRSLKYERIYLHEYISPREVRRDVDDYINFYNNERPHQSLGYRTPAETYFMVDTDEPIFNAVIHRPLPKGGESSLNHTQLMS